MKLFIAHLAIIILNWAQPLNTVTWLGQVSDRENVFEYDGYYKGCIIGFTHDMELENHKQAMSFCRNNLKEKKEYDKAHKNGP